MWTEPQLRDPARKARLARILVAAGWVTALACSGVRRDAGAGQRSDGPVTREEAERRVLELVNRAREEHGLRPVEWDEVAARAAERHAEDMCRRGFTSHWGSDGSVPEQRHTDAGGVDMVQENAACFFDGIERVLDPAPRFLPAEIERIQSAFLNEVPPNDGHRRNILEPRHNRLGVGLAKPKGVDQPCMAQEFVDHYGIFAPLPAEARIGESVRVAGAIQEPLSFGGVGVARIEPEAPISPATLNSSSLYRIPEPYVLYFPPGFKSPKPVTVSGRHFVIDVPLSDQNLAGRYEISVWGRFPGNDALVMLSLRTVQVGN